jgi:hypothetical protein
MADPKFLEQHHNSGWWPYFPGKAQSLESTVWCAIACRKNPQLAASTISYLLKTQEADGGWATEPGAGISDWSTGLALLGLNLLTADKAIISDANLLQSADIAQSKAQKFLSNYRTELYNDQSRVVLMLWKGPGYEYPHGWPWTKDTFHWVEPTCYAILGLLSSPNKQPKLKTVVEHANEYLSEVACVRGGWNYGCKTVLKVELEPIPMPTCLGVLALQNQRDLPAVKKAVEYLNESSPDKNTLIASSWSILALDAIGQNTAERSKTLADRIKKNGLGNNLAIAAIATIAANIQTSGNPFKLTA